MNNFMDEKRFTNKFVIDFLIDFLENNKNNINTKLDVITKEIVKDDKNLGNKFKNIVNNSSFKRGVSFRNLKKTPSSLPIDSNNNLLLKEDNELSIEEDKIVWNEDIEVNLRQIIQEHKFSKKLQEDGLEPSNKIIFHGPPGVGKTLAAKCLSKKLKLPLYVLDLATVMSSYLGKTGTNIKAVFDFAIEHECILLLDEFDAVAKQRGDDTEIGELKRLVTVLLQSIDNWNSKSILIAATNHQELLDRAIWRRFDEIIEFKKPNSFILQQIILKNFSTINKDIATLLSETMVNESHALVNKVCLKIRKSASINDLPIETVIVNYLLNFISSFSKDSKILFSKILINELKYSQRKTSELLGISRDTIRRNL
jgi:SpoVK/Ycf46/Vps4 family AAA+-type ATPase